MGDGPLLFCHVPKAAGTSVLRALEPVYPDVVTVHGGELRLGGPDPRFLRRVAALEPRPRLLYGHFSFGVHELLGLRPRYATFLRDPVQRIVSLYRHLAADPTSELHDTMSRGLSLREFVSAPDTEQTNNHMCRMLAGIVPRPGVRVYDDTVLETALENLRRHFVFVGIVERFAESMRVLETLVGEPLRHDVRVNVAPGSAPAVSTADVEAIRAENALDLELFARARDRSPADG